MKLLIVAGGGGHFSPALALIENLPKDWEVLFIGRKYTFEGDSSLSFEYQSAKELKIPFQPITTGRLQRKFTRHTVPSLFKTPVGLFQATKILNSYKPDVVLSFGGYVSVPVCLAAFAKQIPIVVHEQTLKAGLANTFIARFAEKICVSWKQSESSFPTEKTVLTGNPLRKEFFEAASTDVKVKKTLPVIYVTGGSSGSHTFNLLVKGSLEKLLQKYIVIHQTGDAKQFDDYDTLLKTKEAMPTELQKRYIILKFVDPAMVVDFLKQADLVVSRSGMNTVTEILFLGKPCLLIPLPFGQKNEQLENAIFVKTTGLAEVVEQHLLNPDSFYTLITEMMKNLKKYTKYSKDTKKMIELDAASKIIEVVQNVKKEEKIKNK